jgi:hypothetical protein
MSLATVGTWEEFTHGEDTNLTGQVVHPAGRFRRDGEALVFAASTKFPVGHVPLLPIEVEIDGRRGQTWGWLDTGAYRSVVPREVVEAAGIDFDGLEERRTNHGTGGAEEVRVCPGTIRLRGGILLTDAGFLVPQSPSAPFLAQVGADLVVGLDCLRHVDVTFANWCEDTTTVPTITLTAC